ncbi:MAG TPA: alpha/beta hydrolase-fold protein [Tepidisphaeraceae bacterium]|jgi:enterochelin esterase family protein
MATPKRVGVPFVAAIAAALVGASLVKAQEQPARPPAAAPATQADRPRPARGPRGPVVISPEVRTDRHVVFRILAPKAEAVRLNAGDIPNEPSQPRTFTKGDNGVWELTLGPIDGGTYRYMFDVDGVQVVDPRSPAVSESNGNAWSVVHVPGHAIEDEAEVPHGAVTAVHYRSTALGRDRRMHVYTPPGYETSQEKYPVFYLLHGAGDSDDSWTSVGRANFILDNLIASGEARPMIVVMPAGHTGPFGAGAPRGADGRPNFAASAFEDDFVKDIVPCVESQYRVLADRPNRAIAGLSMGGAQTLNLALAHPTDFAWVGVFSSGLLFRNPDQWEKALGAQLDDAKAREGLKLLWFRTGSRDFLLNQTRQTVDLLKKHGFNPVFDESEGGHTWINWRDYLQAFAPQLFR